MFRVIGQWLFDKFYTKIAKNNIKRRDFDTQNLSLYTKIVLLYYKKPGLNRKSEAYGCTVGVFLNIYASTNGFGTFLHHSDAYAVRIESRLDRRSVVLNDECSRAIVGCDGETNLYAVGI